MAPLESPVAPASARVDVWTWAVRLYPTRSAATAACRAGHVKIEGVSVKAAHPVQAGDTVRALTRGGERIVVVKAPISKRVGAPVAVLQYDDLTPTPPPKEERPADVRRDPGTGRPTKRDRRAVERLRGH